MKYPEIINAYALREVGPEGRRTLVLCDVETGEVVSGQTAIRIDTEPGHTTVTATITAFNPPIWREES